MEDEFILCEECGEELMIGEDGCTMVGACKMFGCPHSEPDREEGDPLPLDFANDPDTDYYGEDDE